MSNELYQYGGSNIFAGVDRDELAVAQFLANGKNSTSIDIPITGRIVQSKLCSIYVVPDAESIERLNEFCSWIGAIMVFGDPDAEITEELTNSLFINNKNPDDSESEGINYIKAEYTRYSELNIHVSSSDSDKPTPLTASLEKKNYLKSHALVHQAHFVARFKKMFLVSQKVDGSSKDQLIASVNVHDIRFDGKRLAPIPFYNITGVRRYIRTGGATQSTRRIRINLQDDAKKTRDLLRKQMAVMSFDQSSDLCRVIKYDYATVAESFKIEEPKLSWNPYDLNVDATEDAATDAATSVATPDAAVQGGVQVVTSLKDLRKNKANGSA